MKHIIITSVSFLAISATAAPLARSTVDLLLAPSYNNTPTPISIPFSQLTNTSAFPKSVSIAVSITTNVPIPNSELTCQCFQDAAGTNTLGDSFTDVVPGTSLSDDQPVQISSILCAAKAQITENQSTLASSPNSATARAQVDYSGESNVQGEGPVDGSSIATKGHFAAPVSIDAIVGSTLGRGRRGGKGQGVRGRKERPRMNAGIGIA